MIRFLRLKKIFPIKIPDAILLLEIVGVLIKLIYYMVDPLNFRKISTFEISIIFLIAPIPITVLTTTLLLLSWNSIIDFMQKKKGAYKIITITVNIIIAVCAYILLPLGLYLYDSTAVQFALVILVLVTCLGLSIYIFYTVPRIIKAVKTTSKKTLVIRQTKFMFATGIITTLSCLSVFLLAPAWRSQAYYWNTFLSAESLWLCAVTLCHILVINTKIRAKGAPITISTGSTGKVSSNS